MIHGFLNINKDRGITSHGVINKLRRIIKQSQIGHTGTLDPEATGVLVVGLGDATKTLQFLDESQKVYHAEIILGQTTDTQDATGKVIAEFPNLNVSLDRIKACISELTGNIKQTPPMYSAVKVQGKKLYELAREGHEIERSSRDITVYSWELLQPTSSVYRYKESFFAKIVCSKGTYIRTLINDLGIKLGCGAHMGALIRVQSGNFQITDSISLEEVQNSLEQNRLEEKIISINDALSNLSVMTINDEDLVKVKNGGKLSYQKYQLSIAAGSYVKVLTLEGILVAIARLIDNREYQYWQPVKVFNHCYEK